MTNREPDAWPTRIRAITLFVEDLPAAKEFYRTVFGLPVHYEDDVEGRPAKSRPVGHDELLAVAEPTITYDPLANDWRARARGR